MHIVVCIKQVPDPDKAASMFEIDEAQMRVKPIGVPPTIGSYEENALELALRLRDEHGGKITVLSMGPKLAERVLLKTLAAGADELVLLTDQKFARLDGFATAVGLSEAIKKMTSVDLVLFGCQASDTDGALVGLGVGELLGWSSLSLVKSVEKIGKTIQVERVVTTGIDRYRIELPAALTIKNETMKLRHFNIADMKNARKKPVLRWSESDLKQNISGLSQSGTKRLSHNNTTIDCNFIQGGSPQKSGAALASELKRIGVI